MECHRSHFQSRIVARSLGTVEGRKILAEAMLGKNLESILTDEEASNLKDLEKIDTPASKKAIVDFYMNKHYKNQEVNVV